MFAYLSEGILPDDEKTARRILYDSDNYVLDEGALYYLYTPRTKKLHDAYAVFC